jgi:hypothetical protein
MPETREVEFPHFDKLRHLKYGFQDFMDLETRSGMSPTDWVGSLMKLSPNNLRLALWIGLRHEDRRVVTPDWVTQQLQKFMERDGAMTDILGCLDEALTASGYFKTKSTGSESAEENPPTVSLVSSRKAGNDE